MLSLTQQANSRTGSNQNPTCVFGSNVTAGNLIAVGIIYSTAGDLPTISSVTDTLGHTYKRADTSSSFIPKRLHIYYAENISGGANTVTVNFSGASPETVIQIIEISKPASSNALDVDWVRGPGSVASPATSDPYTTIFTDEFAFVLVRTSANGAVFTAGSGFTLLNNPPAQSNFSARCEYQIYTSKQTNVTASMSYDLSTSSEIMVTTFHEPIVLITGSPVSAAIV